MNLSLSYFIWNSSKTFPVKSVFWKLIKMFCWLWIFTYATMFIPSYDNLSSCFTDIIFARSHFPSQTKDETWLVLSYKLNSDLYVPCFLNYNKGAFFFFKTKLSHKLQRIMFTWFAKRHSNVNWVFLFFFKQPVRN